jgi:RNA 3'-terminal phosphate cyclase
MEKAEMHAQLAKLEQLVAYLSGQGSAVMLDKQSDLNRAIEFVINNLRPGLTAESLAEEIAQKRLIEMESWW